MLSKSSCSRGRLYYCASSVVCGNDSHNNPSPSASQCGLWQICGLSFIQAANSRTGCVRFLQRNQQRPLLGTASAVRSENNRWVRCFERESATNTSMKISPHRIPGVLGHSQIPEMASTTHKCDAYDPTPSESAAACYC